MSHYVIILIIKTQKGENDYEKINCTNYVNAPHFGGVLTTHAAAFNAEWYAQRYPDVVEALGNSPATLQNHYNTYGRKEGRMANDHDTEAQLRKLFNANEYATLYPDVKAAFGDNAEAMFQHYITYGILETRRPSEQVSYESAAAMKTVVTNAMTKVGLKADPGSRQLAAAIEGSLQQVNGEALQAALSQVQNAVDKAVEDTKYTIEHAADSDEDEDENENGNDDGNSVEYQYDNKGRVINKFVYSNGVRTQWVGYRYKSGDFEGWYEELSFNPDNNWRPDTAVTYDSDGNPRSKREYIYSDSGVTRKSYQYDNDNGKWVFKSEY